MFFFFFQARREHRGGRDARLTDARLDLARGQEGEDARVHDPQPADAVDASGCVHDGGGVGWGAHFAWLGVLVVSEDGCIW